MIFRKGYIRAVGAFCDAVHNLVALFMIPLASEQFQLSGDVRFDILIDKLGIDVDHFRVQIFQSQFRLYRLIGIAADEHSGLCGPTCTEILEKGTGFTLVHALVQGINDNENC